VVLVLPHLQKKKVNKWKIEQGRFYHRVTILLQLRSTAPVLLATAVSPVCLASFQSGSANVRKMLDYTHLRETFRNLSSWLLGQRVTLLHSDTKQVSVAAEF
jgi:hypothetical protein